MSLLNLEEFINFKIKVVLRNHPGNPWHGVLYSVNSDYIEIAGSDGKNRTDSLDRVLVKDIVGVTISDAEDYLIKKFEQSLEE